VNKTAKTTTVGLLKPRHSQLTRWSSTHKLLPHLAINIQRLTNVKTNTTVILVRVYIPITLHSDCKNPGCYRQHLVNSPVITSDYYSHWATFSRRLSLKH